VIDWQDWSGASVRPELPPGALHLWRLRASDGVGLSDSLSPTLSPQERARAARYRFDEPRLRFILGRATLRWVLGGYLDATPDKVRIAERPDGKPCLVDPRGTWLQFNLAHSADLVVILLSAERPVGVDIEAVRTLDRPSSLSDRLLNPEQRAAVDDLDASDVSEPLLWLWTQMEALGKATGRGLAAALGTYTPAVDLTADVPFRAQTCCGDGGCWRVQPFRPAAGYVGTIAVAADSGNALGPLDISGYLVSPADLASLVGRTV